MVCKTGLRPFGFSNLKVFDFYDTLIFQLLPSLVLMNAYRTTGLTLRF